MKHFPKEAFGHFERKSEEDDPGGDMVEKAIADLTATVEKRLGEIEKKADHTALVERMDKIEAKANRAKGEEKDEKAAATAERKAFAAYLSRGDSAPADELKTLTVANDPQGGYLAPPEVASEFIRNLVEFSPIRSVASVRQTTAPAVIYPKRTGVTNAKWVGEIEERPKSEPSFGQAQIEVHELATYVDVSKQLLADSGGQAEAEVRQALAEDFGQKEAVAFVSGSGVKQPEGILTNDAIPVVNNGHATNLGTDALIALMYALPAMYRNRGTWALNGTTLAALRTVKDANGAYIWQPSLQVGQPESLLGRPVIEMVDFPDVAAAATPILFGDFSGYRIVDRLELATLVDPYTQATNGITRIHGSRRVGGRVLEPLKFRKLAMAV